MPQEKKIKSFTARHNGLANVLVTETFISQAFDPATNKTKIDFRKYNSLWDTGATNSAISQKVVDECSLKPIGVVNVSHAGGISQHYTYLVNIFLRNHVGVSNIRVTQANLDPSTDILIGMDIITLGDFAITNVNGETVFSFRTPSVECIDFTKPNQFTNDPSSLTSSSIPVVGRNNLCPCGSRKKYKDCHGK